MRRRRGREFLSRVITVAALCMMGAASIADAQGTVTGRVVAQGTNEPLADARVLALGTNAAAISAQDGKYTLTNVRSGSVEIQVLRIGFAASKKTVIVNAGATTTADFVLETAIVRLQEVVSTATGQQRKIEIGNNIA